MPIRTSNWIGRISYKWSNLHDLTYFYGTFLPFGQPRPILHHKDHQEWLSKIDFYQDQIKIFQKELSIVLREHPDLFSIIEHVDEYRAILLKKLTTLDEIRRQIVLHEKQLAENLNTKVIHIWSHDEVRKNVAEFEQEYKQLKQTFRMFVAHQI